MKRRPPTGVQRLREVLRRGDPAAAGGQTSEEIESMRRLIVQAERRKLDEISHARQPSAGTSLARPGHGHGWRPALALVLGTAATVVAALMLGPVSWREGLGRRIQPAGPGLSARGGSALPGRAGTQQADGAAVRSASEPSPPPVAGGGETVSDGAGLPDRSRVAVGDSATISARATRQGEESNRSGSREEPTTIDRASPQAGNPAQSPELTSSRREDAPPIGGSPRAPVGSRAANRSERPAQPDVVRDGPRRSRATDSDAPRPPRRIELVTESGRRIIWIVNPDLSL